MRNRRVVIEQVLPGDVVRVLVHSTAYELVLIDHVRVREGSWYLFAQGHCVVSGEKGARVTLRERSRR